MSKKERKSEAIRGVDHYLRNPEAQECQHTRNKERYCCQAIQTAFLQPHQNAEKAQCGSEQRPFEEGEVPWQETRPWTKNSQRERVL